MSKKNKNTAPETSVEATESVIVEVVEATETKVEVADAKAKGRPANPTSKRQMKIAERNEKREAGLLKKGRPTVEGSKRQVVLAAREAKKANGEIIKRGRPKVVKVEEPVVVVDVSIEEAK